MIADRKAGSRLLRRVPSSVKPAAAAKGLRKMGSQNLARKFANDFGPTFQFTKHRLDEPAANPQFHQITLQRVLAAFTDS